MKITSITAQKKKERYNVYVDDEFWCGISERTLAKNNLYKGRETTEAELDEIFMGEIQDRLYDRCLGKIGRRPHSVKEIERYVRDTLWKKKKDWFGKTQYEGELKQLQDIFAESVVKLLEERELISDRAFADWWVEQRTRTGKKGWVAIESELFEKGVPREIIREVKLPRDIEKATAREAYEKICKRKKLPREKCIQRLLSRGFTWEVIHDIIKADDD